MRFLSAHTEIYSQMASGGPLISNPAYISTPKFEKLLFFFPGHQIKIWACGFSWFTGSVGLWTEVFFVKTDDIYAGFEISGPPLAICE
jgi:hypothetical protein